MNDTELIQAFKGSWPEEAFATLVRRYAGLVYSTARRRLLDASLAEDITQIVFIRFAKKPPQAKNSAELAAWLHRTTVNVTIDLWRSETRRRARELQAVVMEPATPETAVWEEISPKLDEALNQLNDDDRQALLLRFFSRKSMNELGAILGVSEDAAKMRVSRALDRLRTQMGVGAAACTAAVLGTLLAEHSVEAAPVQLIARLSAMKPPALAGLAGAGGLLAVLFRTTNSKLAAGAVALALLATIAVYRMHSAKPQVAASAAMVAQKATNDPNGDADDRQFQAFVSANQLQDASASSTNSSTRIHVFDVETGKPIPGAKILAICFANREHIQTNYTLYTDTRGTTVIPGLAKDVHDEGIEMDAIVRGYIPESMDPWGYHDRKIPSDYTIKLEPAMTISGTVEDEDGRPVSGVQITEQTHGGQNEQGQLILFQPITSGEDGSWSYPYVPHGMTNQIPFILTKDGYAETFIVVPVSQVDLNNLVFVINKGYTITGRVTDSQQQPIPNARIGNLTSDYTYYIGPPPAPVTTDENGDYIFSNEWVHSTDDLREKSTTITNENGETVYVPNFSQAATLATNEDGAVALHEFAAGSHLSLTLEVTADDFVSQTNLVALTDITNVANFTLLPGNIVRGTVRDEAGNPITNAEVKTLWPMGYVIGWSPFGAKWQTHTDAYGKFEWDSAPAGTILFNVDADHYQPLFDISLVADGSDNEIILTNWPGH